MAKNTKPLGRVPGNAIALTITIIQEKNGKHIASTAYGSSEAGHLVVPRRGEYLEYEDKIDGVKVSGIVTVVRHNHVLRKTDFVQNVTVHIE